MTDLAFDLLMKHEGGFVHDPKDHGGATNMGITIATLSAYLGRAASVQEVRDLTREMAKAIYSQFYWNPLNLDQIENPRLQTAIFDQGVLNGTRTAAERIQSVVGVKVDGEIGPITLAAINSFDVSILTRFVCNMQLRYVSICLNDDTQMRFLEGWMRRTHDLLLL